MLIADANTLGRGVIVKLRDGSVVKYKRATDFVVGGDGVTIVRRERKKKGERHSWSGVVTTRIAHYPLSFLARAELVGAGAPAPRPDRPKKAVKTVPKKKR